MNPITRAIAAVLTTLGGTLTDASKALVTRSMIAGQDGSADTTYRDATVDANGHQDVVMHGHPDGGHVYFKKDFSASEDVIVIDKSDTTNYPHSNTGHIHTGSMVLGIQGDAAADYVVQLGFLENVDATDGDFFGIFDIDGSKKVGNDHFLTITQVPEAPHLITSKFVGPSMVNQTEFQTDVNLRSTLDPTGAVAVPSGDGDMAMRVTVNAGTLVISLMVGYHSHT